MLCRRVLPLALLLPLGCSGGGPAPGAQATATARSAAAAEPAGPPAPVDTSWPLRRVPRWGFSFRWKDASGLTLVGSRDARCGAAPASEEELNALYDEDGSRVPSADGTSGADVTLRFVQEPSLDGFLGDHRFRRSPTSPSGWVAVESVAGPVPAQLSRGGRWWALSAPVSAELADSARSAAGGEPEPDAAPRALAVVERPDHCQMVLAWGDDLVKSLSPVDFFRLLESIRFTGEDERHQLPGRQAFLGFDWHRRLGVIYPLLLDGACLIVTNAAVPEGAPVLALAPDPAWMKLSPGSQCGSVPRQPGDSLHYYDLAPVDGSASGMTEGIGVLAPVHPLAADDPLTGDLDGDGKPESFGFCSARGLYWAYVRSGSPAGVVVWKLGIRWPERSGPPCPAEVAS